MNPEWLRYYIGAKLNANIEDLDFNRDDFIARVNSDLIGKYVNIADRAANFMARHFSSDSITATTARLADQARELASVVADVETRELGKAMREIMTHADRLNKDFDAHGRRVLAKRCAEARGAASRCARGRFRL